MKREYEESMDEYFKEQNSKRKLNEVSTTDDLPTSYGDQERLNRLHKTFLDSYPEFPSVSIGEYSKQPETATQIINSFSMSSFQQMNQILAELRGSLPTNVFLDREGNPLEKFELRQIKRNRKEFIEEYEQSDPQGYFLFIMNERLSKVILDAPRFNKTLHLYRGFPDTTGAKLFQGYVEKKIGMGMRRKIIKEPEYKVIKTGLASERFGQVGNIIRHLSFVSTSFSPSVASVFRAGKNNPAPAPSTCCFLHYIIPPGYPLIAIEKVSSYNWEEEVILPYEIDDGKDATFMITDISYVTSKVLNPAFANFFPQLKKCTKEDSACMEKVFKQYTTVSKVTAKVITLVPYNF